MAELAVFLLYPHTIGEEAANISSDRITQYSKCNRLYYTNTQSRQDDSWQDVSWVIDSGNYLRFVVFISFIISHPVLVL